MALRVGDVELRLLSGFSGLGVTDLRTGDEGGKWFTEIGGKKCYDDEYKMCKIGDVSKCSPGFVAPFIFAECSRLL